MFTITDFNAAEPGEVIRIVTTKYQHVEYSRRPLTFVVLKGKSGLDWAIYFHYQDTPIEMIKTNGNKVTQERNIRDLIPCDDEVFALYRL
jgi:hypothetical protein